MKAIEVIVAVTISALAVFRAMSRVVERAGQLFQALRMLFFKTRSFFKEGGEVLMISAGLVSVFVRFHTVVMWLRQTLAEATLCLSRVRRVVIPIYVTEGIAVSTSNRLRATVVASIPYI